MKEWWSGAHSVFENGSERVSALIFILMSESGAKLKKLMSVEHVDWQCYLAGSYKTAPQILIFSIAMGADY